MASPVLSRRSLYPAAFLLALITVYAAELVAVSAFGRVAHPDLLALGITLDLVVVVPGLVYFLLVRGLKWSPLVLIPAFVASVAAAGRILPANRQQALHAFEWLAIPLELIVVGLIVVKARQVAQRMRAAGPADPGTLFERMREAAREVLGANLLSDALAFEIAICHCAFAGWRARPVSTPATFTYHRKVAYGAIVAALLLVLVAETIGLHLLLQQWSPAAAWVLTALSIYSAFWLLGLYQAVRLRPIRIEEDRLLIRIGLKWRVEVPFADVAAFEILRGGTVLPKRKNVLRAVVLGDARYLLRLARPLTAEGPYGIRRKVEQIAFTVDEPQRFEAALSGRISL
jgi:membrane protein YdbS with pleckstrin-like domain